MSVVINRKISVKSIVTPELKEELGKQIKDAEKQLNTTMNSLNERVKQVGDNQNLISQIQGEMHKVKIQLSEMNKKKSEIESLDFGKEFYQGNLESPIEVALGDNLFQKISNGEIIVNNGEVVEFRNL
ncbi:MAG: YlqD family protein [Candidatus Muiribacteriota bacterium]